MQQKFTSNGCEYDVEILHCGNTDIVRFYEEQNEQYGDAVLTGTLNRAYFNEEMVTDILDFLEKNIPACKNIYLPYHIDFVTVVLSAEYNGEY